tara:strand:+ start:4120 stop:4668 length:549 start_codon:yes stop_codon:yes gene_type:complete
MKYIILIVALFFFTSCSKNKTVLICGDHICVNKKEAEVYFKENLTLEVKIINKKKVNNINLIQLNLKESSKNKKEISVSAKKNTNKKIRKLTKKEVNKIKSELKTKDNSKNKKITNKISEKRNSSEQINAVNKNDSFVEIKDVNNDIKDVCSIIKNCNIDEIAKYLAGDAKKRGYPNISKKR